MNWQAAIFDMDGVLCDSEPLINAAAIAMFRELGQPVEPEDFLPFVGTGENRYIGGVAEKYGLRLDLAAAKHRTYELYLELVPRELRVFPGAVELVHACRAAGLKTAVASSADRIKVAANLNHIGLPPAGFDAVVCAEDCERRKPFPDLFLEALRRMQVAPAHGVVFEDAVNGIEAALAAGAHCVALATSFPRERLQRAHLVYDRIAAVQLAEVRALR